MRTTMRSQTRIEDGALVHHLSTEWIVVACRRALPSLHYDGYIVSLVEAPAWMD